MSGKGSIFYDKQIITTTDHSYYVSLTIYSNLLHIVITNNSKFGICCQYIPHSKMGNDSTQQYTIRDLIGQSTTQHKLIMKQIASSPVICENAIPFLCNLMIPLEITNKELLNLCQQLKDFITNHTEAILHGYSPFS